MSRALADLREDIGKLARDLAEINKAMALGGPSIYPGIPAFPLVAKQYHCTHCTLKTELPAKMILPCTENECVCLIDHVLECRCHGAYQKWCDDHDLWDWIRGLTNRSTPFILTRVIA